MKYVLPNIEKQNRILNALLSKVGLIHNNFHDEWSFASKRLRYSSRDIQYAVKEKHFLLNVYIMYYIIRISLARTFPNIHI